MLFFLLNLGLAFLLYVRSGTRHFALTFLVAFYAIYDLLDYVGFRYEISNWLKAFPDALLLIMCLAWFRSLRLNRRYVVPLLLALWLVLYGLAVGLMAQGTLSDELKAIRSIFTPLLFYYAIRETLTLNKKQFANIIRFYFMTGVVICAMAIYQYVTFDGDYTNVWRYDPLLDAKLEQNEFFAERFMQYQIVRNDNLRSSGVFYSALEFSYFAGFFALLSFVYMIKEYRVGFRLMYFMLMVFLIGGCYVSGTRSSFLFLGFGSLMSLWVAITRFNSSEVLYGITALACLTTFGFIALNPDVMDASVLGRLDQYRYLVNNYSLLGNGYSSKTFDSFYIYLTNSVGVMAVAFFIILHRTFNIGKTESQTPQTGTICAIFFPAAGMAILYLMSFQFFAGSFIYKTYFILLAAADSIRKCNSSCR